MSKRQQRSLARMQEFQLQRRLRHCRLRKVALQVLRRLRHERLWRVFRESRASHALGPACDSAGRTTAPLASMEVDCSANRAEPAAKATLSPLAAEFAPGLPVAAVAAAWRGAAAAWDKQLVPPPPPISSERGGTPRKQSRGRARAWGPTRADS